MRRREIPCHVSTYVRKVESAEVSSMPGALSDDVHRMLNPDRSAASFASGVYMTSHTHRDEFVEGTNRGDGVKSTRVSPFERRTSACTFNVDWRGVQGSSQVFGP